MGVGVGVLKLIELTLDRRKVTIKEKELGIMTSICRSKRRIPGRVPLLVGVGLEALGFAALLHLAELHVIVLLQQHFQLGQGQSDS